MGFRQPGNAGLNTGFPYIRRRLRDSSACFRFKRAGFARRRVSRANIHFGEDPENFRKRRRRFGGGPAVFPRVGGQNKAEGIRTIVWHYCRARLQRIFPNMARLQGFGIRREQNRAALCGCPRGGVRMPGAGKGRAGGASFDHPRHMQPSRGRRGDRSFAGGRESHC
jgi:hypothetical protein